MKRKFILILLVTVLIFSCLSVVFAFTNKKENGKSEKNLELISIAETYAAIDSKNISKLAVNKKEDIVSIANTYLKKFEYASKGLNEKEKLRINDNNILNEDDEMSIEYNYSGLKLRNEIMLDTNEYALTINADTGKIINYSKHMSIFPKCELEREKIEIIANELFKNIDICNVNEYEMIYLEEYDEGIWWVAFAKKYGDLINSGEIVKFHFIPETKEIWVLGINNIAYDNNEVLISEEMARNIANQYLEKSVATDMKISLAIVNPNEMLLEGNLRTDKVHSFAQYMRKAYVCEFNNEAQTQIYIDCTTGDVLGGTMMLGGDF